MKTSIHSQFSKRNRSKHHENSTNSQAQKLANSQAQNAPKTLHNHVDFEKFEHTYQDLSEQDLFEREKIMQVKRLVSENRRGMDNQWDLSELEPGQTLLNPNIAVQKVKPTKPEIRKASDNNFATKMYAKEQDR